MEDNKKKVGQEGEKAEIRAQEVPLPAERMDHAGTIFDWISGWKSSWEENDIEKHISCYREKNQKTLLLFRKALLGKGLRF